MKRILMITALILMLTMLPVALFSCNSPEETEAPTEAPTETETEKPKETEPPLEGTEYSLLENIDKIKINGRYTKTRLGIACDNLGSGIEFNGVMKGKVYLEVLNVLVNGQTKGAYYTVYIDGQRQEERLMAKMGRRSTILTIADFGETEAEHHIRVVKQTEARYARAEFIAITMDGEFKEAPKDRDLLIEFVGSDLICGMGNYNGTPDQEPAVAQTAEYEDGTQSISFIVAEALNADCSILGVSGMGVAGTWMPPVTAPLYYKYNSYYRDNTKEYDFENGRKADLIVLNIGKNDGNIPVENRPTDEVFRKTAKEYLQFLKEKHGDEVKIIWTYDISDDDPETLDKDETNDCRYQIVEEILAELGGEEAGLYICQVYTNRLGGQKHTDMAGHKTSAEGLLAFIEEKGILG